MAIRRGGRLPASPILMSSQSRSLQRSYAMPTRSVAPLYPVRSRASSVLDSRANDYYLFDRVSDVSFLSNATLDESDDAVRRSRGRDQQLLREATSAIVSAESYATPQSSVASRRVARGRSLGRAASVPPRPYYPTQVDGQVVMVESTTEAADSMSPYYEGPVFRRPVVVYGAPLAARAASRARSVPPIVVLRDSLRPRVVQVAPGREDRRSVIRAKSVPPAMLAPAPRPVVRHQYARQYARGLYRPRPVFVPQEVALPTAGLKAHRVPRLFLTRGPLRTGVSSLWGYYGGPRPRREVEEPVSVRRTVARARLLATPLARAPVARGKGRYALPYYALPAPPKPKPAPLWESLSGFPKVYVPRKGKGRKPSNRAKAAIIASKMEPDPMKRRRPRSEYAAKKYRELRNESKESIYSGLPSSGGLHSSVPPARTRIYY